MAGSDTEEEEEDSETRVNGLKAWMQDRLGGLQELDKKSAAEAQRDGKPAPPSLASMLLAASQMAEGPDSVRVRVLTYAPAPATRRARCGRRGS